MAAILKIKNDAGTFVEVPALKGSDGYTPVRGVDYYTEADKDELTAEIIDSISIPTKTSELTNDSLFISEGGDISDLSNDVGYLAGTDTTLTQEGKAADAKTVGTQLATKQNIISDLSTIRSGAAAGATAIQTETDPTVPSWAKQTNKPSYEANEITYGDSNIGAAMGEMEESIGNLNEDLSELQNTGTTATAGQVWTATSNGAGWADGGADLDPTLVYSTKAAPADKVGTVYNVASERTVTGKNRADPSKFVADRRADSDTTVRSGETSTDWIPIVGNKFLVRYAVSTSIYTRIATKNSSGVITLSYAVHISNNGTLFDVPDGALYVRTSSTTPNSLRGVMIAFTDTIIDFEEFYEYQETSALPAGKVWKTTLTGAGWVDGDSGSSNPWYGKKMVVDGDSITHDGGLYNYWQFQAANLLGMTLDVSNRADYASGWKGVGGSRIANDPVDGTDDPTYNIVLRYQNYPDDADIVLIAGGTNDWAHGNVALGDFDSTDIHTFNGALNTLLPALKEKYPTIPVVMMTPIKRGAYGAYGAYTNQSHLQLTQEQFVNAMIAKCRQYNVYCLDMWANCPINPNIESMADALYNRNIDLVHPNVNGHKVMGKTVAGFIRSIS